MSRTLEILDRLIAFPTVSSASNLALIDYVEALLTIAGFATHRIMAKGGEKAGLFARRGPQGAGGVLLSAHSDVVPVAGQAWSVDPFVLRATGGRLYGRGTTDMKGFLAAALAMAEAARTRDLAEPLMLALSWDEEVGCLGIPQMLPHLATTIGQPRLAIVGEPTSMQLALGHKGKAAFRATCGGRAGHSAMAPDYLNAIHLAAEFVQALRGIQTALETDGARDAGYDIPYATIHAGRIEGGQALNIVPDMATVDFEYRYPDAEDPLRIDRAIADAATALVAPYLGAFPEAGIRIERLNAYPGLSTPEDDAQVAFMRRLLPKAALTRVGYGTEAGYFAQAGIASIVCGPGDMAQGHRPDEYIERTQLDAADRMMARLLDSLTR